MNSASARLAHAIVLLCVALWGVGCDDGAVVSPDASPPRVACPVDWVPGALGGCGPAVLLCAPNGGAAAGVCANIDLTRSHPAGDGGVGESFRVGPDGEIAGAWRMPGEPGGPPASDWVPDAGSGAPAADWVPDAGIPTCPAGWRRTDDGVCDPVLRACPEGAESLPGGECTHTAAVDCPTDAYADPGPEAVGSERAYVSATAPSACEVRGSRECPWPTIGAALASGRAWVLVGDGTYRENLAVTSSVHVIGRCATQVRIDNGTSDPAVSVQGASVSAVIRGITISGNGIGVQVDLGASVSAQNVRVDRAVRTGIRVIRAATFEGSDIVVADMRTLDGDFGDGASVDGASHLRLRRTALLRDVRAGTFNGGGELVLRDVVISENGLAMPTVNAVAIYAKSDSTSQIERVVLSNSGGSGVMVTGVDGTPTAMLTDVVIRGTRGIAGAAYEAAVRVQGSAILQAERLLVDENLVHGVLAEQVTASPGHPEVVLRDSVIRGPTRRPAGSVQRGILARHGCHIETHGVRVARAAGAGVKAENPGALVDLFDSIVEGTVRQSMGATLVDGCGAEVANGAHVAAHRTVMRDNAFVGAFVSDSPHDGTRAASQVDLEDSVVRGSHYDDGLGGGGGVVSQAGGEATVTRSRVVANEGVGVNVLQAHATIRDSVVEDTIPVVQSRRSGESALQAMNVAVTRAGRVEAIGLRLHGGRGAIDAFAGETDTHLSLSFVDAEGVDSDESTESIPCLIAEGQATIEVDHGRFHRCFGHGVVSQAEGSSITLRDSLIQGTRSVSNAESTSQFGRGFFVVRGATASLERVLVEDNPEVGVIVDGLGSHLALSACVVRDIRARSDEFFGQGLMVQNNAQVTADRLVIAHTVTGGLYSTTGATTTIRDSLVEHVESSPLGGLGDGIVASDGTLIAERIIVRHLVNSGVFAHFSGLKGRQPGDMTLRDTLVVDVRSNPLRRAAGLFAPGIGVYALPGGQVHAERLAVSDVTGIGILAATTTPPLPTGGVIRASDVWLRTVRALPELVGNGLPEVSFGVLSQTHGDIELTRGLIDSAQWGIVLNQGRVALQTVVVARQSQGFGQSWTSRESTALVRDSVVSTQNLSSDMVYDQRSLELDLSADTEVQGALPL